MSLETIEAFIEKQGIDTDKRGWRTKLPKPPQADFGDGKTYFWNLRTNKGNIKVHLLPLEHNLVLHRIDLKLSGRQRAAHIFTSPAQDGLHTGQKLTGTEWLGNVIIRPEFKPHHLVGFKRPGSKHDDWQCAGFLPQSAADLKPVHPGEHHIKKYHIQFLSGGYAHGVLAIIDHERIITFLVQGVGYHLADVIIILND